MENFESFGFDLYPSNDAEFREIALRLFRFQASSNATYAKYLTSLGVDSARISDIQSIPFLPVEFFRNHRVITGDFEPEVTFLSSGTTGTQTSRHEVRSVQHYLNHSRRLFEQTYGPLTDYHIFCLLPSYLERTGSSLVAMASHFIQESQSPLSGFYLNDLERLATQLEQLPRDRKTLLLGVSFALLDLAEQFDLDLSGCVVMETGGMKGRRKEITREELHTILKTAFHTDAIHSEYGMTELLSQAYSTGQGVFRCPPSVRVLVRELNDPFGPPARNTGIINIVDLANVDSCAFIETRDLGRIVQNGDFEVIGRADNSDIRGCNLLVN